MIQREYIWSQINNSAGCTQHIYMNVLFYFVDNYKIISSLKMIFNKIISLYIMVIIR